jgi:lipoprotein-releasing system permease protein
MLPFQIARRFLWRSRFQSALIVVGIAIGIGTQVFVGSLITSLQASLIDTTVGNSPHVTFEPAADGRTIEWPGKLEPKLRADAEVTAIAPQHLVSVLARFADATDPLVVRVAEADARDSIYAVSDQLVAGDPEPGAGELLIGVDLADERAVEIGDETTLVTADGDEIPATVSGVFDLGVAALNTGTAFAGPELAADVLDLPADAVDVVEVQVASVFSSDVVGARYDGDGLAVTDWQAENRALLTGLQSQSVSSIMIQVFVVIAVGLGIASTLAVAAVQKTRQIGILKALGLTDRRSGAVFLWQAGILGVVGTALGLMVGWGLIAGFDAAASGSEALFPVSVDPGFAALSAGIGIGIALLSAVIPYRTTTRLDPIEVIQNG